MREITPDTKDVFVAWDYYNQERMGIEESLDQFDRWIRKVRNTARISERERIIALLEAQLPTKIEDAFDELIGIHEVIALIKVEN